MNTIYLLLGSNLGNRQLFLQQAIKYIAEKVGAVIQQSSLYETQAWGNTETSDYLNQVLKVESFLTATDALQQVLNIETELGRERQEKWGARVIDIDILFYNQDIIHTSNLIIPHPHLHERRFTLEPLAEIAPELLHPLFKKNILSLKENLSDALIVKKL
ncbi:2-amino-4-hydroxy-6-hydroxymethyldihydropteridine diphosphokinase [Mucilaginibacter koreensis]